MKGSVSQPESDRNSIAASSLAKTLAPEDVCVGDYVAVLRITYEVPSYVWGCCDSFVDRSELVHLHVMPEKSGEPLKVKAICLPFVLLASPSGQERTMDVRRHQFARIDKSFARAAWKATRTKKRKRKKGRRSR